ncbi:MAG: hypothetical protein J0M15_08790 [Deltaproteobacteria bacterium]|jgi:hypothetical protein|nr:hypothetical protein [Deltaproteobacteria bacterium]
MRKYRSGNLLLIYLILVVIYSSNLSAGSAIKSNSSCIAIYQIKSNFKAISLIDQVINNLNIHKNNFPLLVVTDSLKSYLEPVLKKYALITDKIEEKSRLNNLQLAVTTTEKTLQTFYDLLKHINNELEKSKRNEEKIKSLSVQMKSCLRNISTCQLNIRDALQESNSDMNDAKEYLEELKGKVSELKEFKLHLENSRELSDSINENMRLSLLDLIATQIQMVEITLPQIVNAHLTAQSSLMTIAELQMPSLLKTKVQAAEAEARGAYGIGALQIYKNQDDSFSLKDRPKEDRLTKHQGLVIKTHELPTSELSQKFRHMIDQSELSQLGTKLLKSLETKSFKDVFWETLDLRKKSLKTGPTFQVDSLTPKDIEQIILSVLYNHPESFFSRLRTISYGESRYNTWVDFPTDLYDMKFIPQIYGLFLKGITTEKFQAYESWLKDIIQTYRNEKELELKRYGLSRFFPLAEKRNEILLLKKQISTAKKILRFLKYPIALEQLFHDAKNHNEPFWLYFKYSYWSNEKAFILDIEI